MTSYWGTFRNGNQKNSSNHFFLFSLFNFRVCLEHLNSTRIRFSISSSHFINFCFLLSNWSAKNLSPYYFLFCQCTCSGMVFLFLYPIFQLVSFYVAIGGDPKELRLGIVNDEVSNIQECFNKSLIHTYYKDEYDCELYKTSCAFLNHLNRSFAVQVW